MRASAVSGIIFANSHDETVKRLTDIRSMASVPFGGRYRLIDFALSNFVNAGISNVGIITKEKYRSLMDHIGSGIYWDLDRKKGGIHIMPPFNIGGTRRYHGHIEALYGANDFLKRCNSEYIVLSDSSIVANVDLSDAIGNHIKNGADVTVIYKKQTDFENSIGAMSLITEADGKIVDAKFPVKAQGIQDISMGIFIFNRNVLIDIVDKAYKSGLKSIEKDLIAANLDNLKVYGTEHTGVTFIIDSPDSYKTANMSLLKEDVRRNLFLKERPIYTKTRDDMPTRFGTKSDVKNCFIADGCVIEGTVKNSILFRGVKVEKGATVENSILMQGVRVGKDSKVCYTVSDKNADVGDGVHIEGTKEKAFFIEKNQSL